jgi:hypothetical protein
LFRRLVMRKFFGFLCVAAALTAFIGCESGAGTDDGAGTATEETTMEEETDVTAPVDGAATEEPVTDETTP